MSISLGTTTITAIFLGTTSITSAYLGATQVFGGSFTPLDLFSGGAQGIWLDPSDLSTMFSDRAGTIPVTTPGTVVGKRLDKSGRGNHAVAPTDAARPTYGVEPKGGVRNRLLWSEGVDHAAWLKTAASVPITNETAPDGTATADKILPSGSNTAHYLDQSVSKVGASTTFTISLYAKADGYSYGNVGFGGASLANQVNASFDLVNKTIASPSASGAGFTAISSSIVEQTPGSGWFRITVSGTTDAATIVRPFIRVDSTFNGGTYAGNGTSGLFVWGAQLELGSTATAYQKVTTAYDITESGVATCHYVQYDGSDDSLSTSAIDFTATDKMSVFAGVRKLSDAATAMIVESSADAGSNNGAFRFLVPGVAGYEYRQRGTLNAAGAAVSSGYASPISNVLTGLGDIGGDTATLRINGTQVAQSTADQGTGNYGNYPLFIGRRNNGVPAPGLPFNGKDYGILVVGKAASAGEISDTETWLAARTAQVTI